MMVMQCRRLRRRRIARLRLLLNAASLGRRHHGSRAVLIGWMVKKSANVVDKERVEKLGDLLLVCKIKSSFKGDPMQ